jgi:hypothetical protein
MGTGRKDHKVNQEVITRMIGVKSWEHDVMEAKGRVLRKWERSVV